MPGERPQLAPTARDAAGRADLVRRAYDAWNWYGVERFGQYLADDVILEDAPDLPDAHVTRGAGEVVARLDEIAGSVGGGWVDIRTVEEIADSVLVAMTWNVDRDGAASVSVGEVSHLVDLSLERITRIRVFLDRESAARA